MFAAVQYVMLWRIQSESDVLSVPSLSALQV